MTQQAKSVIAHFMIKGTDLTRLARDVMLSERPDQAWRILADSLQGGKPGESEAAARAVLDGTKRLTGDSHKGVGVAVDRRSASYQKSLRFIYAGRVRVDNCWYRPVAKVVAFGMDDATYATRGMGEVPVGLDGGSGSGLLRRWFGERVDYYASRRERVFQMQENEDRYSSLVIFEPCGEPPFWWKPNTTVDDALKDFLDADRVLSERGVSRRSPPMPRDGEGEEDEDEDPSITKRPSAMSDPEEDEDPFSAWLLDPNDEHEASRKELLSEIARKVREAAGDDTFDLTLSNGRVLTVPRAPFQQWALHRTSLKHLAPPWKPISPSGVKLPLDEECHTDWMLGAGLDVDVDYRDDAIRDAAYNEMYRLQTSLSEFEAAVVVDNGDFFGEVGSTIAVLPDLSADHEEAARKAGAIITERGGAMAHLAVLANARAQTIMLVPDAMTRFLPGMSVKIEPGRGWIDIHIKRS